VERKIGKVAYELVFLETVKRNPVLHVCWLKRYELPKGQRGPPKVRLPHFEEEEWEVEKILKKRTIGRQTDYLVQ